MGDIPEDKKILDYDALVAHIKKQYTDQGRSAPTLRPRDLIFSSNGLIGSGYRDKLADEVLELGVRENFWMLREALRFSTREYTALAFPINNNSDEMLHKWLFKQWKHYVHLSRNEPGYIAYTPDENYGKRDRRVKTTVGRYLKKFYADELSDADIRKLTDTYRYHFGVEDIQFAETEADIINVYVNGPHSCMAYGWTDSSDRFGSHLHPAAAYANSGLKVAYLKRDGDINCRALVYENPEDANDKRVIRVYGDEVLRRKLEQIGYVFSNLRNVKLRRIPAVAKDGTPLPDTFVCPYIDDVSGTANKAQYVIDEGEHLRIVDASYKGVKSTMHGAVTSGLIGLNREYIRCNHDEFRIYNPDGTRQMSPRDKRNAVTCSCCGKPTRKDDCVSSVKHEKTHICPSCVPLWTYAYCEGDTRDFLPISECVVIYDHAYQNTPASLASYDIVALDAELYAETSEHKRYVHRTESIALDGKIARRADVVALSSGGEELKQFVVKTFRKIATGRKAPTKPTTIRIDPVNGWLRTAEGDWPTLSDWIIEVCVHNLPAARRGAIDNMLKGEIEEVRARVHSWIPELLTAAGMPELINEAKQLALLVEED